MEADIKKAQNVTAITDKLYAMNSGVRRGPLKGTNVRTVPVLKHGFKIAGNIFQC
jgi:hypothetical protein